LHVVIVGGGIGGLALALFLHQRGISCRVFESAPQIKPLGVGISLLPHGTRELASLGLLEELRRVAVEFRESCFFNGFGQLILRDAARPEWPQFLIHRAELHGVLLRAVYERLGERSVALGHRCTGLRQDDGRVTALFADTTTGAVLPLQSADVLIGCDGIHSAVRKQFYPDEGAPVFSGINTWRGITRYPPFLSGGSHVRAGALDTGKMVIYPIRDAVDDQGRQLINWLAEIRREDQSPVDWNRPGRLEDFLPLYANWRFDWLDVADMIRTADQILEFPMSDRDPVPQWTFGRAALLGDAAHPMLPRGSNGAMQAIIDARVLADELQKQANAPAALKAYEARRLAPVNRIVLTNRSTPPDTVIQLVHERSGGKPFSSLDEVISPAELREVLERYKSLTGSSAEALGAA